MTPLPSDILKTEVARDAKSGEFIGYRLTTPRRVVLIGAHDHVPRLGVRFVPEIAQTIEYRACAINEGEKVTQKDIG